MSETEAMVLLPLMLLVVAWGMYQAGHWKGDRDAWREADVETALIACLEFDLEEMTTQRDQLVGYADELEARAHR